jgi:hypothetical protein
MENPKNCNATMLDINKFIDDRLDLRYNGRVDGVEDILKKSVNRKFSSGCVFVVTN